MARLTKDEKLKEKERINGLISDLRSKGLSNGEIAERLDLPEVRIVETLEKRRIRRR